jgi:hypothetical protein
MWTDSDLKTILGNELTAYVRDRSMQRVDPVFDFLFEYYRFSPAKVLLCLSGRTTPTSFSQFPESRKHGLEWVMSLLEAIASRPISIGCDGLHEWAMVYRQTDVRHPHLPLRLPRHELDAFVASSPIRCSHFDAFRFFTPEARPLNRIQPESETRHEHEQGGCLHANMDVYRWAYSFHPWTSDAMVIDAFILARDIRILDMQASPYDVTSLGLTPVAIETEAGREEYRRQQLAFAHRATELRQRLLDELRLLHTRRFHDQREQVGILDKGAHPLASGS